MLLNRNTRYLVEKDDDGQLMNFLRTYANYNNLSLILLLFELVFNILSLFNQYQRIDDIYLNITLLVGTIAELIIVALMTWHLNSTLKYKFNHYLNERSSSLRPSLNQNERYEYQYFKEEKEQPIEI